VANNFFYLLANGGTNRTSGISVEGIGIAKAERIWYVALAGYMTSSTNFAQARVACLDAATQLFGNGSIEVQRVGEAWAAVGAQ
jgi:Zn-dependent metalloprotease